MNHRIGSTMSQYEQYFQDILNFLHLYNSLINCHMVDFITENLWARCLPKSLRSELENIEIGRDNWLQDPLGNHLNDFFNSIKSFSLEKCPAILSNKDLAEWLNLQNSDLYIKEPLSVKPEFMKMKKFYEVEILGKMIGKIAKSNSNLVIDAGAGKAYLSMYLAEHYNVPVLAIDSSKSCHKGAIGREEKMNKRKKNTQSTVQYVVEEISDETDYDAMVKQYFHDWNLNKNLIITGLHTCGPLVHFVIRTFLKTENIDILTVVPCCYHLTNESLTGKCNLSKNARMLAQQSIDRSFNNRSSSPSLFYRTVLQVLLHSMGLRNAKIGRGGPINNFSTYAEWALERIGIDRKKVPGAESLERTFQKYQHLKERFDIFQMLRVQVSPVIEAAIMLDRIIFLQNSGQCSKIGVSRLFDPMISPRCYAIIALK